jgi:hypothetical protein
VIVMADFSLLLEAPDRQWAGHIEALIHQALGERGSLRLGVLGEGLQERPVSSGCFVTGVVVCDGSDDEILPILMSALNDFEVETHRLDAGVTQIVVRPLHP